MQENKEYKWKLVELISKIASDRNLLYKFLQDLLSPYEFTDLATRWQIIKQLHQRLPHRRIAKNLHIGIGTVTRGSIVLKNKTGGFNQILKRYGNRNFQKFH